MSTPLTHALELSATGIPCFACGDDKAPLTRRGLHDATTDQDVLRSMFRHRAAKLAAVPTGVASKLDVLDIDAPGLAWLAENRHRLPVTREHCTRSGGLHVLFQANPGLRNSVSRISAGIDVRAGGGYCVWWPAEGLPVRNPDIIAPWPEWLVALLLPKPLERKPIAAVQIAGDRAERYAQAALMNAAQRVASAVNGSRNSVLNAQTFAIAPFIREGQLSEAMVVRYIASAAAMAGLPGRETVATISSALRAAGIR